MKVYDRKEQILYDSIIEARYILGKDIDELEKDENFLIFPDRELGLYMMKGEVTQKLKRDGCNSSMSINTIFSYNIYIR